MTDVKIRTTITANSILPLFGPPGAVDYRTHPNQRKPDSPIIISNAMKQKEALPLTDIKILKNTIYSFKNRKIITMWIRNVCKAFSLKVTTLALAVVMTDSYIVKSLNILPVNHCQLIAIVCTWISAKFEELADLVPTINALVDVCDGAYTREEILNMEEEVLKGFGWKIPHSTCANFVYLYLHMHGNPEVARPLFDETRKGGNKIVSEKKKCEVCSDVVVSVVVEEEEEEGTKKYVEQDFFVTPPLPSGSVLAHIYIVTPTINNNNNRRIIPVVFPVDQTFHRVIIPILCKAANVHYCNTVEIFELAGDDFIIAKRIPKDCTPNEIGMKESILCRPYRLFISVGSTIEPSKGSKAYNANNNNNNNNTGASALFAEVDNIVILRSLNSQVMELAEELVAEAVTHVEFLRLPSHVVSLAVIGVARALICKKSKVSEVRAAISFIILTLKISTGKSFAAAELLVEKYKETLLVRKHEQQRSEVSSGEVQVVKVIPDDIHDKLRYIFSRERKQLS